MNLFDLHSDMPTTLFDGLKSVVSFPRGIQKQVQTCAVFIRDDISNPYDRYKSVLGKFKSQNSYPVNDLTENKSILLSVEGGSLLEENYDRISELYSDKIAMLSLVWNYENKLAGGVTSDKGITDCGKRTILEMNDLGMVLDVSHLNDKGFYSALELADYLVASHSNCRKLCQNKRNLTDEQLMLIGEKGGLIGVNFYPVFLGDGDVLSSVYNHISHMLELGLENNISIGSDFDGALMSEELNCTEKTLNLYLFLEGKGIKKCILDKIFYENALNFFKNAFDKR